MLNREAILNTNDLPLTEMEVPEWGGSVMVRGLTGKERDEFEQSLISLHGQNATLTLSNARARLVYMGCVDEKGERVFSHADIAKLGDKNGGVLDRLSDKIRDLSGLNDTDMAQAVSLFTIGRSEGSTID